MFSLRIVKNSYFLITERLTQNSFHRFLCLIGSTAFYKENADQECFCLSRFTDSRLVFQDLPGFLAKTYLAEIKNKNNFHELYFVFNYFANILNVKCCLLSLVSDHYTYMAGKN